MSGAVSMTTPPSEDDVIAYLKKQPDFFQKHADVLDQMKLPGAAPVKGIADFQSALLERLKADKRTAQKLQRELIDTVRANNHNYSRIQTAVLVLLEAESFEEFILILTQDFPTILDVDTVSIVIESTSKEIPFIHQAGIRFVRAGMIKAMMGDGDALLQANINGAEDIFGPGAGLVKSHALLRIEISKNTPAGIIAFGSRNPEAFAPDQGIDQIGFLAQVVERCFRFWIDLEE
jgi:uncharacterized protein YigA (DUF484 family)